MKSISARRTAAATIIAAACIAIPATASAMSYSPPPTTRSEAAQSGMVPVWGKPTVTVDDDPTRWDEAGDICPLEDAAGLTWDAARRVGGGE
jgi:hypothetical protein